ncbi:metallopeptidase family protein [Arthrobacter sp. LAPM80]|uniref:metallopeptidase family protein n=1 Tax=Arthrobacter sp. LAPM80 TaxID=3141788 RepID=UPI00398AA73A
MQENPLAGIPSFGRFTMDEDEFDAAVQDAIAKIPADISAEMDNVAIFTAEIYVPRPDEDPDTVLLGLYEGTPLTERDSWWGTGSLPDRITIFRRPILGICHSREEVIEEVTVTVVHEIAHHFGISDERLHELGWG